MSERRAGLLAHPTSLPGPFGIGDLGPHATRFLDWAAEAGQSVWQILPLAPVGAGHSPYACLSAFAGNPLLISPTRLDAEGWLAGGLLDSPPAVAEARVEFERLVPWKNELLRRSWEEFRRRSCAAFRRELEAFIEHEDQAAWLEDWALYAALKARFGGRAWTDWDRELKLRRPGAVREAGRELADAVAYERYLQFLFFRQWREVRRQARRRGIEILGDLPFYVAYDSADVWANPHLFRLDAECRPVAVAGAPPDYFSETGQLWGHPIYRWDRMAADGFAWWVERLRANLRLTDRVRLDHFRAFAAYWEVDAEATSAVDGSWVPGPGAPLFEALRRAIGALPLVAEDLGMITEEVRTLRRRVGLPCMRVLQFAFDGEESEHRPERHSRDTVVYTGTHDNDTLRGWFAGLNRVERRRVLDTLGVPGADRIVWRMIEAAYDSVAELAVVPLQDPCELGSEARMNRPGTAKGNWRWRVEESRLTLRLAARLRALSERSGRLVVSRPPPTGSL